jgi:hypothetical protein
MTTVPPAGLEVYLGRRFNHDFLKARIPKDKFNEAIKEIILGSCDSLGHKLFKKRIGGPGRGKRGSFRSIAYYRDENLLIFIDLFGKNEKENISEQEKKGLVLLSKEFDLLTKPKIEILVKSEKLIAYEYHSN